jgi:hypothetical protein
MAVAFTRTRADLNAPVPSPAGGANIMQTLYAVIDITTTAVATNTIDVGYLPKGAIPVGGYFACVDIDTGTEVLDMDLGITANGVDSADPDFFMNGGVFNGDAVVDILPAGSANGANFRPLIGPFPVTQLGAKTLVQWICNTAANAGGTGKFAVCIHYIMPGVATS